MKIDVIYEQDVLCEFVYSPLFEMFCALHVLSNPEHHIHRQKWVEKVNKQMNPDMKQDIKIYADITDEYCIIMDVCHYFEECSDLNILSSIDVLSKISIHEINKIFKEYDKKITKNQYQGLLRLLRDFYINIFEGELKYIEPFIARMLKQKVKFAKEKGIFNLIQEIHERIKVHEDKIVFYKNKQYEVYKRDLKRVSINVSTFVGPHLLIGILDDFLNLTCLVETENSEKESPKDLERTLKALGDSTRLKILKAISKKGKSTQELSSLLDISEAAVSKALKLLQEGQLVTKERKGNYMIYSVNNDTIDFISYRIYEYIY